MSAASPGFSSAACVLADEGDPSMAALHGVVATLDEAGLAPIVAVVARGVTVPSPACAVHVESRRRDATSGLRFGLTQLLNVPVTGALVVPATAAVTPEDVRAMLAAAREGGVLLRGGAGGQLAWVHRDAWRDLMTSVAGLDDVARRYGVVRVA